MNYHHKALLYAEKYGIVEYTVMDNTMVYYESFPLEQATYKAIVNLDTMQEQRKQIGGETN